MKLVAWSKSFAHACLIRMHSLRRNAGSALTFHFLIGSLPRTPDTHWQGALKNSFNDVAVHDCQLRRTTKPYEDAQNRLLWRDKTCLART